MMVHKIKLVVKNFKMQFIQDLRIFNRQKIKKWINKEKNSTKLNKKKQKKLIMFKCIRKKYYINLKRIFLKENKYLNKKNKKRQKHKDK